jgi:hypothetical protein
MVMKSSRLFFDIVFPPRDRNNHKSSWSEPCLELHGLGASRHSLHCSALAAFGAKRTNKARRLWRLCRDYETVLVIPLIRIITRNI